jgi:hypothetical protein
MKPLQAETLVTVMGGASGTSLASWIKPLPAAFTTAVKDWHLTPKAGTTGATSWLTR